MPKLLLFLMTFSVGMFGVSVVSADWYYDFDDAPEGLEVVIRGHTGRASQIIRP
jgi:hypothetical protein